MCRCDKAVLCVRGETEGQGSRPSTPSTNIETAGVRCAVAGGFGGWRSCQEPHLQNKTWKDQEQTNFFNKDDPPSPHVQQVHEGSLRPEAWMNQQLESKHPDPVNLPQSWVSPRTSSRGGSEPQFDSPSSVPRSERSGHCPPL